MTEKFIYPQNDKEFLLAYQKLRNDILKDIEFEQTILDNIKSVIENKNNRSDILYLKELEDCKRYVENQEYEKAVEHLKERLLKIEKCIEIYQNKLQTNANN